MFMFDRDIDFVTPLLTQLTYEGSIDEHFNIESGSVKLPSSITGSSTTGSSGPISTVILNAKDPTFESIRSKHFAGVSSHLVRKAKEIQLAKENSKSMSAAEMKKFVADELKELQNQQLGIALHLSIYESITKAAKIGFERQLSIEHGLVTGTTSFSDARTFFEDLCARRAPVTQCLRLLCLMSLTQSNGLSLTDYHKFQKDFLYCHGFDLLPAMEACRSAGLLIINSDSPQYGAINPIHAVKGLRQAASNIISREKINNFPSLIKALKLVPDQDVDVDLHNPSDLSYVFNGAFTPVIPKIVLKSLTARDLSSVTDALRLAPGATVCEGWSSREGEDEGGSMVLVVILGGVTYAELAALKLVALSTGKRIVVASTDTVSGNKIVLDSLGEY